MSNAPLLFVPGGNGNASASQRREHALRAQNEKLLAVIATLVTQQGGFALVPLVSLARQYDFGWKVDEENQTLVYTASVHIEPEKPEPESPPS